ncbi:hypothetical protein [Spartinivicinus ruber]|uniref:hypothetical protein n=1 Tax=Spartinivicinus ruber TaxID=2683272 RepID=UPI0013D571E6|nr:hypothetical protein [Spartinivicinus ruber]
MMKNKLKITKDDLSWCLDFDKQGRVCLWSVMYSATDEDDYSPDAWFAEEGQGIIRELAEDMPLDKLVDYNKRLAMYPGFDPVILDTFYADKAVALSYALWVSPVLYTGLSQFI